MSALPPWENAKPLPGCEVIRPTVPEPIQAQPSRKKKRNAVVTKLAAANRFLDSSARLLSPASVLVWMLLWRDERGGTVRTAVSDLARRSGLSARTVKRALRVLREGGFVATDHRGTPTTGPTVYRLQPNGV